MANQSVTRNPVCPSGVLLTIARALEPRPTHGAVAQQTGRTASYGVGSVKLTSCLGGAIGPAALFVHVLLRG